MSFRNDESRSVMKTISSLAAVALTATVLMTCAANLRSETPAPPDSQTTVSTATALTTNMARSIASRPGLAADLAESAPTRDLRRIGAGDGLIPADETLSPFDVDQPAVGNLNPDLLREIQRAATDAAIDGIEIRINSGWRSARYQQQLLNEAITTYGSEQEALKWVDTPEQSSHVAGKAIDIAPTAADDWLLQHGDGYGLCQMYANEIWHFELAVEPGMTCPAPKADASDG
jgi:hypothetical protein